MAEKDDKPMKVETNEICPVCKDKDSECTWMPGDDEESPSGSSATEMSELRKIILAALKKYTKDMENYGYFGSNMIS